ncbi:unnamed protein product [Mytilus coruscus]|uniref:Uncharacterized protein n=1 Tax=Mytilus coruscus TaxID=42192 RepID=A0A6J8C743_MYTCO|nr:unnamed protein product [Mytilus coruscus]
MPVVSILNSLSEVEDKILEHELESTTKFITQRVSNSKHLNIRIEVPKKPSSSKVYVVLCEHVATTVLPSTSGNQSSDKEEGNKAIKQVLTTLKSIMENKSNINFAEAVAKALNISPPDKEKITKEKQHPSSRKEKAASIKSKRNTAATMCERYT